MTLSLSVMTRVHPYTINEIEALLMAQEDRIERQKLETTTLAMNSLQSNLLQTQ